MSDQTTLACDMTAIPDEERERHRQVSEHLLTAIDDVEEASNGYRLRLPADGETIRRAAAFVSRERLCCPFFDFILEVGREGGPVWLALSGGPGVKDYLEEALLPRLEEARRG
jgi:hypothetical protein